MRHLKISSIAVLAAALLGAFVLFGATALLSTIVLAGPATAGAAPAPKPVPAAKTESTPPLELLSFTVPGTGGWVLGVSASPAQGKGAPASIGLQARGPHHEEVDYIGLKAKVGAEGSIAATVPGQGRIAVHFDQTSESVLSVGGRKGCTVQGKAGVLKGVFRGTIELHGEGGYTTVTRRGARGEILLIPGETCPRRKHHDQPPPETSGLAGAKFLLAGRDLAGGSLEFSAFRLDRGYFGSPPETEFVARYVRERHGVLTVARTEISDEAAPDFTFTAPHGMPSGATVDPPAPFGGTATFTLESPTKASWTGDLSVEVPTLGTVELAGPGFWSGACADKCTKTFPPGSEFAFGTASRLP